MTDPAELQQRIASLSPEQRARLERWLVDVRPSHPSATGIPRRDPSAECPLSPAQERLWVLQQIEPELIAYNIPRAWRLKGPLDVSALRRAFEALVERHEVLRTTYGLAGGEPVQVIAEHGRDELRVVDLAAWPAASRDDEAMRRAAEDVNRPFDLTADPVLRPLLIRLGPAEHLLAVSNHHIASDGWSAGIMARELSALYAAFSQGRMPTLPPLPIQYADYALWQRGVLGEAALQEQIEYWRGQLDGAPPELALPTDRPRPPQQTYRGARQSVLMPIELAIALRALARRERVTPFMLLMSAFFALLSRYTGQDDLVVGTAIAGRTRVELEPLLGFFVNTLAVRADVSGDPPFRELLQRVRAVALAAFAHQDLPFARVVQEVRPERRLDRSPLVQVMFVVQDANARVELVFPDVSVAPVELELNAAQHDLTLSVTDTAAGLAVRALYSTDLFEAETVSRLLGHFQTVLAGIVAEPEARLSALPVLSPPERRQALVGWNPPPPPDAISTACIHELVAAQAARRPEAVAVTLGLERLTYGDLNARANRLARALRRAGVGPEALVGVCVEPSLDLVVGLLAILKAGAAYLPLDPGYPPERLAFMLDDARVAALVTHREHVARLPAGRVPVICLDEAPAATEGAEDPGVPVDPQNLAYVIYTSGSSGRPKGVLITHANVTRLFAATRAWFEFGETDVWTLFHSPAFDFSVWEMWGALVHGGRLVIVPYLTGRSPEALHEVLRAEGVTVLNQTPSAFRQLVPVAATRPAASSLRAVVFGGEALDLRSLEPWVERCGDCAPRLINMYGITETTVHVTYRPLDAPEIRQGAGSPIGRPIPDLQLYLLDRGLEPVPVGVPGELYVGGPGLARGYLNQPALTAERFIPDPFARMPGGRLYRTGDLGRRRPDGDIEYLGRADQQVKLRGFRIELGEVEGVLRAQPAVRDAAVAVRELGPGDARLIAYVVFAGPPVPAADLRRALRETLPEHMVPAAFVPLDALPLTSSGKLDRRALPAGVDGMAEGPSPAPATGDALTRELATIWARVLRTPRVGPHDNFFDLGGHSLLAVRLMAEVERRWHKRIPLAGLFQAPTVAAMAALLADRGAPLSSSLVAIQASGDLPPLFCVPEHTGTVLCFEQLARHLAPDQPVYGLEPLGLDGRHRPHTSIEDMAAHYLRELRTVQPVGPYYLAGYCFGGLVAFEMAQQLRARDEEVALLALFNTYGPERHAERSGPWGLRRLGARTRRRVEVELANLRPLRFHQQVAYLLAQTLGVGARFKERLDRLRARREGQAPHLVEVARAHSEAMRAYTPREYAGRVTLFWARHRFALTFVDPCFGWRRAAGDLDVRLIPATRGSVVQDPEAVRIAAAELKQLVARAAARG